MKLTESCSNCQGRDSTVKQANCKDCWGKGYTLTHEGKVIAEFIQEHFKVRLSINYETGHEKFANIELK